MARHPIVAALIEARKQRGWSQEALARRLYRSQRSVSYFETRVGAPPLLDVEQIARALGLRLALVPIDAEQSGEKLGEAS